ncbi:MFS transporter [Parapedobacter indicus]|uniref:MFS transporter, DHA1 family, arabinose polymer transporter n=1 Tax=Parapedobacter indicus TaxID=1477437 RepID=A0A1I3JZF4_9SPHI|nr:MFS transporter [Parapedobacter indicus]PPL01655.1 DHA1 family arabinose polymer transporter-like MFS transporter [Parapedobacter indicus]SFI65325.1 MFS transporter, DHA1 family, arabinose polymer transporter [Parapedobacter indicus]
MQATTKKSLTALLLGGLGIGITEFVMMGLLEDIARDLGVDIPTAGHLIAAYAAGVVIGAPLLVVIAGKYPPKRILIGLMILFTVFNAFTAFAPGYASLLVSRVLAGLPHGAFFGVGSVVASRLARPGKEAQAISIMFAGLTIANLIGVPLGTYIGHHFTWRYSFTIVVLVGLITLLSLKLWMPDMPAKQAASVKTQLRFFRRREAWLIVGMIAIGTGGLFSWYSYISPLMTKVAGFSESSMTYILMLAGVGMLVGNLLGGRLADLVSPAKASLILLAGMVVALVAQHYLAVYPIASLVMTFILGGIAFALSAPIQILMINTAKGSEMLAASVSQASFNIGNALGAFLGGLPIAMGYGYASPEWVGAAMAACGALFALTFILQQARKSFLPSTPVEILHAPQVASPKIMEEEEPVF